MRNTAQRPLQASTQQQALSGGGECGESQDVVSFFFFALEDKNVSD